MLLVLVRKLLRRDRGSTDAERLGDPPAAADHTEFLMPFRGMCNMMVELQEACKLKQCKLCTCSVVDAMSYMKMYRHVQERLCNRDRALSGSQVKPSHQHLCVKSVPLKY